LQLTVSMVKVRWFSGDEQYLFNLVIAWDVAEFSMGYCHIIDVP